MIFMNSKKERSLSSLSLINDYQRFFAGLDNRGQILAYVVSCEHIPKYMKA